MTKQSGYREALKDDESLAAFLRQMAKFDRRFCEAMVAGEDYTLKLEVHGCAGELLHCRVLSDEFDRPNGASGRVVQSAEREREKRFRKARQPN